MKENEIIHTLYEKYMTSISNNPEVSPENLKSTKALWTKLMMRLETTAFVRGGLLPLIARKLDDYWTRSNRQMLSFQSMLDSNPVLMGFLNGTFDFKLMKFKPGDSRDYIAMSTFINYIPFDQISQDIKNEM